MVGCELDVELILEHWCAFYIVLDSVLPRIHRDDQLCIHALARMSRCKASLSSDFLAGPLWRGLGYWNNTKGVAIYHQGCRGITPKASQWKRSLPWVRHLEHSLHSLQAGKVDPTPPYNSRITQCVSKAKWRTCELDNTI